MPKRQPALPHIWLVSDARNDAALDSVLERLPRGSGLIFRHYHLPPGERRVRFAELVRIARRRRHAVALSAEVATVRRWGASAAYGAPSQLARGAPMLRLVSVHSLREIAMAHRARADAILLSPAFATRSHAERAALGPLRFRLVAARALVPVIALGGMTARRARRLGSARWAAIDGLCGESKRSISKLS